MAKLESKLGLIPRGKIGDLVFYESNKKTFIRTTNSINSKKIKPLNTKYFKTLSEVYSTFLPVMRFDKKKEKLNSPAIFNKYNFQNVKQTNEGFNFDFKSIVLTNSISFYCFGLKYKKNSTNIQFQWDEDSLCQNENEKIMIGLFYPNSKNLIWKEVYRKDKFAEIKTSESGTNYFMFVYGYRSFE